ncbi:hypothetical protein SEA_VINE_30 [Gordonia phage Vine]|uniref:Uncharacterized protein n=1 Tax=Gordonia phage Vine TaxID=2857501 RepID=A0AAE8BV91_9CAUD|nr:hypothetical protein PP998_gp30 [Gordonia phage Vine]QZD97739.1 hypothetical protein SEA_VINE_30 [Gordonia phage Vine]
MIGAAARRVRRSLGVVLKRQKMNQTSGIGDPSGNKVKVPMTSDSTYLANVTDSVMAVVGTGTANIVLNVNGSGNIFANVRLTLERNGVAIGSVDIATHSTARTATISAAALVNGDQLALYAQRIAYSSLGGNVNSASVDVVPA